MLCLASITTSAVSFALTTQEITTMNCKNHHYAPNKANLCYNYMSLARSIDAIKLITNKNENCETLPNIKIDKPDAKKLIEKFDRANSNAASFSITDLEGYKKHGANGLILKWKEKSTGNIHYQAIIPLTISNSGGSSNVYTFLNWDDVSNYKNTNQVNNYNLVDAYSYAKPKTSEYQTNLQFFYTSGSEIRFKFHNFYDYRNDIENDWVRGKSIIEANKLDKFLNGEAVSITTNENIVALPVVNKFEEL